MKDPAKLMEEVMECIQKNAEWCHGNDEYLNSSKKKKVYFMFIDHQYILTKFIPMNFLRARPLQNLKSSTGKPSL